MGRNAYANSRTLNAAVRRVFKPHVARTAAPAQRAPQSVSKDLIPTQPEELASVNTASRKRKLQELSGYDESSDSDSSSGSGSSSEDVVPSTASVITHYIQANLPKELVKYWYQRYRLFSRYDEGIQMDYDGWFSVTPENIAAQIAEQCRCDTIVDGFCGVGGNAIQFAMTCKKVIAIDNSAVRLACAKANAELYGVEDHIQFIHADFVEWIKARQTDTQAEPIDAVFMSPPWGGIDYEVSTLEQDRDTSTSKKATGVYPLKRLAPLPGRDLFSLARSLTRNVAFYLPRNVDISEACGLVGPDEKVLIEEEWMGSKLKALCMYYGDLTGQASQSLA